MLVSLLLVAAGISCRREAAPVGPEAGGAAPAGFVKEYGTGPVRFTLEVPKTSITTADAVRLRMVLRIGEGFTADFPDIRFPEDVPGLVLTDFQEQERRENGDRLLVREYELEPEHDGTFRLPSLQVYHHKADEVKEDLLETEPVELKVTRTPVDADSLAIRPVRGLVTAAEIAAQRRRVWPWWLAATAGAVILGAGIVRWLRRPRPAPPPPPAHEIALEALRQLVARDLVGAGRVEQFFVEITGIVREYIERAFGLRAPEQTTEEFLAQVGSQPVVAQHRQVLAPFLTAADEVKFARAMPDRAMIQRAFDTARDFVLQTSGAEGAAG